MTQSEEIASRYRVAVDVDQLVPLGPLDDDRLVVGVGRHLGEAVPDDVGVTLDPAPRLPRARRAHCKTGAVAIRTPSRSSRRWSCVSPAFGVVSSLSPRKMLFAPAWRHSACSSSLMEARPADSRTTDSGMRSARRGDRAHELEAVERLDPVQRRARHLHEQVDRHALRMRVEHGQLAEQPRAVGARLAHADDAAAAQLHARLADVRERVEPVLIGARRDDLAVELRRRVEVVVVVVESGCGEGRRLRRRQHAERRARLEPERADLLHRGRDRIDLRIGR